MPQLEVLLPSFCPITAGNPTQNTMDDFTSTLILAWLPCNELTLCEMDTMCAKHTTFPPKSSNDYSTGEMLFAYSCGHESQRTQMASSRLLNTDKLPAHTHKKNRRIHSAMKVQTSQACWKAESESEVAQSCLTLSDPMDHSLPGSSIYGIFQARVLEWGAIAFSQKAEVGSICLWRAQGK